MQNRRTFLRSTVGAGLLGMNGRAFARAAGGADKGAELAGAGFRGEIVTPGSPRYDESRRMFVSNPRRENRPQIVAFCADEDDVRRALAFARQNALEFSVRSGGHDMLAASICNGLVIDLSALQTINIDGAARTVRLGAGVRAGALNAALAEQGLAAILGCDARVGVSGLTLGGGLGWLAGRHGAACDHLIGARLVTADGRVLRVGKDEQPELLWALRGGGGNFGVVTELTLAAHPAPSVTQGVIAFNFDRLDDFLRRHRDYLASAGDDVELETFLLAPDLKPMAFIKACYSGDPARAEKAIAPLRALGAVAAEDIAATPYTGVINPGGPVAPLFRAPALPRQDGDVPGFHVASASMTPISDQAAAIIAERIAMAEGGWAAGIAHYVHGAAARTPAHHSAMPRTDGLLTAYVTSFWRRPEQAEARMAWADEMFAALQPHAGPTYINYMTSEGPDAVRRAYGDNYPRLAEIKRIYDPDNVFRRNRNIRPAIR